MNEYLPWSKVLSLARRADPHYSMSEREQELLYELALITLPEGAMVVELGVCHGKTAVVLALAAAQKDGTYIGIDDWSLEGTKAEVWMALGAAQDGLPKGDARNAAGRWELWEGKSWDLAFAIEAGPVDFLLIDAGHDEANISRDCEIWIPRVRPGGIVVFDDWPSGPGWENSCHEAVRRNAEAWTKDWEWVAGWGKMVVRRRPRASA